MVENQTRHLQRQIVVDNVVNLTPENHQHICVELAVMLCLEARFFRPHSLIRSLRSNIRHRVTLR